MKEATQDDIVELIRTADRAFVEGTPEAMEELRELVEKQRKEYSLLRAVPRGVVPKAKELSLFAAAPQMLKALQHAAEYFAEASENYEEGRKPAGLRCAEEYVQEAILAAGA
jgi:hypothetical protein